MAIEWNEEIEPGASVNKADLGEIKGNIDDIAEHVDLELTWEEFGDDDLPDEDRIKSSQAKELRDKTETIDTNKHSVAESGHDSEVDDVNYSGNEDLYQSSYDGGYNCGSHDGSYDSHVQGTYLGVDCSGHDSGVDMTL